jgi:hypothetical protein
VTLAVAALSIGQRGDAAKLPLPRRIVAASTPSPHHGSVGFDLLAFLFTLGVSSSAAVVSWLLLTEREKASFIQALASEGISFVGDIESGDLARPLAFTLLTGSARVHVAAVMRGEHALWQLERTDVQLPLRGRVIVVDRGWRNGCRDARGMEPLDCALPPRVLAFADDPEDARAKLLIDDARLDLLSLLLGGDVRQCVLGPARMFLEVARSGFDVDEVRAALVRLAALHDVAHGMRIDHAVLPVAELEPRAQLAPSGAPIGIPAALIG